MANNFFGSDSSDMALENVRGYIDDTGLMRIKNPNISSYNFDGLIPNSLINVTASAISPGMKVSFTGSSDANVYYNILSILNEDEFVTGSALTRTYIEYLDENSEIQSVVYGASSTLPVLYEDWSQKYLGTNGWYISNQGNAIFSNVAVRGQIEATSGTLNNVIAESGKVKELNIGKNYYPIRSIYGIQTSSATTDFLDSGQFEMTVYENNPDDSDQKYRIIFPGERFRLSGVVSTGSYLFINGFTEISEIQTSSSTFNTLCIVLSHEPKFGSGGEPNYWRYICKIDQLGLSESVVFADFLDFFSISALSGSFNMGHLAFGEILYYWISGPEGEIIALGSGSAAGPDSGFSINEGIQLINEDTPDYLRDYIDFSGRFRLGKDNIRYQNDELFANISSGSFTGYVSPTNAQLISFNARTASYTLVLEDAGKLIEMGSNSAQTLNVPVNASVQFPIGTKIDIIQTGTGETTIVPQSGVTINSEGSKLKLFNQWAAATLIKRDTNLWFLAGLLKT